MKFNENRSKGSGDMERTQISRVKPMTLKPDLESSLGSSIMDSDHRFTKRNICVKIHENW